MLYSYTALDGDGNETDGTIEASSMQDAKEGLHQQGIEVKELYEAPQNTESPDDITVSQDVPEETPMPLEEAPAEQSEPAIQQWEEVIQQEPTSSKQPKSQDFQILQQASSVQRDYHPLVDTLTLYAGWLLASYAIVYALAFYQIRSNLPFRIPFIEGLLYSPLVLIFAFATFLFLFCIKVHRHLGGGLGKGFFLVLLGVDVVYLFKINIL